MRVASRVDEALWFVTCLKVQELAQLGDLILHHLDRRLVDVHPVRLVVRFDLKRAESVWVKFICALVDHEPYLLTGPAVGVSARPR